MTTPIAMTTYRPKFSPDRTKYLRDSIASLERSGADMSGFVLYDDCSTDPDHVALLGEIGQRYKVVRQERTMGAFLNVRSAITRACTEGTRYVVYLQDDIACSKDWLAKGLEIFADIEYEYDDVAILSLYNLDKKVPNGAWARLVRGHPGAVAWIVRTDMWHRYCQRWPVGHEVHTMPKNDRAREKFVLHLADWKICHCMSVMEMHQAVVKDTLIDHRGAQSAIRINHMDWTCNTKTFVGEA